MYLCRRCGRKITMLMAGIFFMFGAIFTALAYELPQLVIGRIVLGAGVGRVFSTMYRSTQPTQAPNPIRLMTG